MLDKGGPDWQEALKGYRLPRTRKETQVYLSGVYFSVDPRHEKEVRHGGGDHTGRHSGSGTIIGDHKRRT